MCCGIVWTCTPWWIPGHFSHQSVGRDATTDTRVCFQTASVESVVHCHADSAVGAEEHSRDVLWSFAHPPRCCPSTTSKPWRCKRTTVSSKSTVSPCMLLSTLLSRSSPGIMSCCWEVKVARLSNWVLDRVPHTRCLRGRNSFLLLLVPISLPLPRQVTLIFLLKCCPTVKS